MSWQERIRIHQGDITKLDVDVIVNAANTSLLGGGGVDGAIHKAAGPKLVQECRMLSGCKIGQAKIAGGYQLKAAQIIHTVGPVWQAGSSGERDILATCYSNCLKLACKNNAQSIAFPGISTGRFRFPLDQAATIAIVTCAEFLETHDLPAFVVFCTFDGSATAAMQAAYSALSDA